MCNIHLYLVYGFIIPDLVYKSIEKYKIKQNFIGHLSIEDTI